MVSGSPIAGYLSAGIKNITSHMMPAIRSAFFLLSEPGIDLRVYPKTIPNSDPIDNPRMVLPTI